MMSQNATGSEPAVDAARTKALSADLLQIECFGDLRIYAKIASARLLDLSAQVDRTEAELAGARSEYQRLRGVNRALLEDFDKVVKYRDAGLADNARLRAENAGMREALMVGDRVRINRNAGPFCDGYDDGGERFVRGISVDKELKVNVWLCDHWPPRDGGDDGWEPRMLDKIAALSSEPQAAADGGRG